ncbi:Crp/Fnr family transcriptional regulator [Chitinophagaceae bacterium LWZ2-11]
MQKNSCDLKSCFLCQFSVQAWKSAISGNKQTLSFKKGDIVFAEGEQVKGIYFIYEGTVKVHKQWGGNQKELIIRFAKAGDVLGHRGLGGNESYPVSATALENLKVCFINNDFLEASLTVNPTLTYKLMQLYATELQKAEKRMTGLAHMEVKGRIAEALLELRGLFGITETGFFAVAISRQDIASFAGTTYETIFKVFTEWIQEKLIETSGKSIKILQEDALKKFLLVK